MKKVTGFSFGYFDGIHSCTGKVPVEVWDKRWGEHIIRSYEFRYPESG